MIIGFERKVQHVFIDIDKSPEEIYPGCVIQSNCRGPNGIYTVIIVPENLLGRTVVIMPLSNKGKPLDIETYEKEMKESNNG